MRTWMWGLTSIMLLANAPVWAQSPPSSPQSDVNRSAPEPGPGDTVKSRPRPDYDPVGARLGGFFLYPEMSVTEIYRDNIFYTENNKTDDFITVVSPKLNLKSNWNNHALNLFADMDAGFYASNSDENYTDLRAGANGRVDIQRDMNVSGGVTVERLHEDRSSPDQTAASEPVEYVRTRPTIAFNKRFNRLSTRLSGSVSDYRYDDAETASGNTLSMEDRNRREYQGSVRVGYAFAAGYEGFVRGTANRRAYSQDTDDAGFDRSSDGWETVAGLAFDLGSVTQGNIFGGYLTQNFDDPAFESIEGISYGGDLTWNPTRLTTVTAGAQRSVEETTLSGASGADSSTMELGVDHELRRNIILSGDIRYQMIDYDGISREDDVTGGGLGGSYLVNRNFRLSTRYGYATRNSNVTGGDYDTHSIRLQLTAQY